MDLRNLGIIEFALVRGSLEATRLRVETEIFAAARNVGAARLLEVASICDGGVTTLWQTFSEPGANRLPISHVAIVAPTRAHAQIEQSAATRFNHVQFGVFSALEAARKWIAAQ